MNQIESPQEVASSSTDAVAIRVQNLSKCYQIYDNPRGRLKQFVLPSLQRLTNGRIVAWAGYWWFQRTRKGFADAL